MSVELLYTSAPTGVKQGSRGFCTVLSTLGTPVNLATRLETLSGYRHVFPPQDPQAALNPVAWSHVRVNIAGQPTSILSRVAAHGVDYSGRTNKLAHHLVIQPAEAPAAGPAWLLSQPGLMRTSWDGTCQTPAIGPPIPSGNTQPSICHRWKAITGDAGWAGVVAEAMASPAGKPLWIIYKIEQRDELLALLSESIALLPEEQRWQATFSTYYTNLPPEIDCKIRCVLAGTEEARLAAAKGALVDLTIVMPAAPPTFLKVDERAHQGILNLGSAGEGSDKFESNIKERKTDDQVFARKIERTQSDKTISAPPLPLSNEIPPLPKGKVQFSDESRRTPKKTMRVTIWMAILIIIAASAGVFISVLQKSKSPNAVASVKQLNDNARTNETIEVDENKTDEVDLPLDALESGVDPGGAEDIMPPVGRTPETPAKLPGESPADNPIDDKSDNANAAEDASSRPVSDGQPSAAAIAMPKENVKEEPSAKPIPSVELPEIVKPISIVIHPKFIEFKKDSFILTTTNAVELGKEFEKMGEYWKLDDVIHSISLTQEITQNLATSITGLGKSSTHYDSIIVKSLAGNEVYAAVSKRDQSLVLRLEIGNNRSNSASPFDALREKLNAVSSKVQDIENRVTKLILTQSQLKLFPKSNKLKKLGPKINLDVIKAYSGSVTDLSATWQEFVKSFPAPKAGGNQEQQLKEYNNSICRQFSSDLSELKNLLDSVITTAADTLSSTLVNIGSFEIKRKPQSDNGAGDLVSSEFPLLIDLRLDLSTQSLPIRAIKQ